MTPLRCLAPLLLLSFLSPVRATVELPAIFGSNMVLQCEHALPVWGRAAPGERVTVTLGAQRLSTVADAAGSWRVTLAPERAGGPFTLGVTGENSLTFTNVLVGEVWLCSGQSNMTLPVAQADRAAAEVAAARLPRVRLFTVAEAADERGPRWNCVGHWVECSPEAVAPFSAVGYFFGREVHAMLGRPVGLIHSSWGGTKAEAWTPRATLAGDPELRGILESWAAEVAAYPKKKAEFEANRDALVAEWKRAVAAAQAAGRMAPAEPRLRTGPNTQYAPCALYNAMIAPLVPFALRGVAWYQGEANVAAPRLYRRLFPALIGAWRSAWGEELPFLYVQLPNLARQPEPSPSGWAELREAQLLSLATPRTAMAVTIDVGDPRNLHPAHKQPVGHRLALAAGALVYGRAAEGAFCPVPRAWHFDGARVRIDFAHADSGLATRDGEPPRGFVLAGDERVFVPAEARVEGGTIILRSEKIPRPVAARYAWADNPDGNLTNRAGLPASPFRTDDWPTPGMPAFAGKK